MARSCLIRIMAYKYCDAFESILPLKDQNVSGR